MLGRASAKCIGPPGFRTLLSAALFQLICHQITDGGDELRVGGLALRVGNRAPEILEESIQVTAIPCDLNRMADCTLHTAGSRVELLSHTGIKSLGNRFHQGAILSNSHQRIAQVLVALDVLRHAELPQVLNRLSIQKANALLVGQGLALFLCLLAELICPVVMQQSDELINILHAHALKQLHNVLFRIHIHSSYYFFEGYQNLLYHILFTFASFM